MGLEDLTKKASEALGSDKAEEISDKALDTAAGVAKKVSGGKADAKIDSVRDAADRKIGRD
ncbi:Rv0909 family putative TA system antitoxin [Actinomyces wuliandei]|uniref:Rv0909 family putative TA system antitoxin n=1 Tax=Actinomyces wuliandei TaxID=2057743 RepID=UPI000FDC85FB|nr:Rv0909 family putative TA system antitoxin [Actinomyces wuliandei]